MGRASRLKRERKRAEKMVGLLERLDKAGFPADRRRDPGSNKLSKRILELLEPDRPQEQTPEDFQKLASVAVLAWNLSLFTDEERKKATRDVHDMPKGSEVLDFLKLLIERKLQLFPDDKRTIVDFDALTVDGTYHLKVASMRNE